MVLDSISSDIDEVLLINPSANVFVFGEFNVHHKDWLTYSGGTDRSGELYHNFFFILKLVSAIFYEIFIFSPNDSPSKTIKNVFYFIVKALFVLEIFNFLSFFPFLSTRSRFKMTNGSGIIYDVMNWPA